MFCIFCSTLESVFFWLAFTSGYSHLLSYDGLESCPLVSPKITFIRSLMFWQQSFLDVLNLFSYIEIYCDYDTILEMIILIRITKVMLVMHALSPSSRCI